MSELRKQFEKMTQSSEAKNSPTYHSMRFKLMKSLDKEESELPEDKKHFDHATKAEGLNAMGQSEDPFSGKMQDLRVMLADIDMQIQEKTGKESNLKETLLDGIFEMIRKQLSEV